ncbi:MAG: restriction endonuclease [Saprospiraceae bacterium]|nr:restriction endonuclease [Saprospiraceae bacterium]
MNQLPKTAQYHYINPTTKEVITIENVELPQGPIKIKRFNPSKGESRSTAKEQSMSSQMLWRYANAFQPKLPINVERVLGASYNTRSILESLLAHTPQFYYAYPGRIERIGGREKIQKGHKHLVWRPDKPHPLGEIHKIDTEMVISEIPSVDVLYEAVTLPNVSSGREELDIEVKRRHAQIQIALYKIGRQLGFRTWVAFNDKAIQYENKKLGEFEGIIASLNDERLVMAHPDVIKAALYIDCIWFKNGKLMPAVLEIEHSTGVTSGLSRMKNLQDLFPSAKTRYVIVASDDDRKKVVQEANKEQFKSLDTRFFPYSAVEELYSLCERRKLKGITEDFLDSFMEPVVSQNS